MYLNTLHGLSEQFLKDKYLKSAHFNAEHIIKHFRTQSTEFNKWKNLIRVFFDLRYIILTFDLCEGYQ